MNLATSIPFDTHIECETPGVGGRGRGLFFVAESSLLLQLNHGIATDAPPSRLLERLETLMATLGKPQKQMKAGLSEALLQSLKIRHRALKARAGVFIRP